MLSKNKIKFISSLKKKKFRNKTGLFIAEGTKLVEEIVASRFRVKLICATPEWMNASFNPNQPNVQEFITVTPEELRRVSGQISPEQVLAVVEQPVYKLADTHLLHDISLVLDGINDPGNMGAIIRIADWFGMKNVICSPDTVDLYNPKVVQASMGSVCRVRVHCCNLTELMSRFYNGKGFRIYGSFMEGENLYHAELSDRGFVVMGNESHGISNEVVPYITNRLSIPYFSKDPDHRPESLNVSVAAGIVCSEFRRRNR